MTKVTVLLRQGLLETVECPREDVFLVARLRNAGICGVFEDHETAQEYIEKHQLPRQYDTPKKEEESPSVI
jgi:hypothetical protein